MRICFWMYIIGVFLIIHCVEPMVADENQSLSIETINVAISLGLQMSTSDPYAFVQNDTYVGLLIWKNWWNSLPTSMRTTSYNTILEFNITVFENFGRFSFFNNDDLNFLLDQAHNMSEDPNVDFILAPVGTPWAILLRNTSYYQDHVPVTIGLADSTEAWYQLPGTYGVPSATFNTMTSILPYLRVNQAKTATVVRIQENFQGELCTGFINQAPYNNIQITNIIDMPFDYNTFGVINTMEAANLWNNAMDQVIAQQSDVLVICDYGFSSEYALQYLRRQDYTPKAVVLSFLYAPFNDPSLLEYVHLPSGYDKSANYPEQTAFTDCQGYHQWVEQEYGRSASMQMAYATLGGMMISNMMIKAKDNSTEEWQRLMPLTNFNSFLGRISFDIERRQLMDSLFVQYIDGEPRVIGPALAAAQTMVYPMPTWQQRQFQQQWGHSVEIASVVFIVLAGVLMFGWMMFIIVYWKNKVIIAASPLFCLLVIIGAMMVLLSLFSWMPNLVSTHMCQVRPWLLPVGFIIMFGALIAKTYRIHQLYNTKNLKIIIVSDWKVGLVLLCILAFQIMFSILMVAITPLDARMVIIDSHRISKNYMVCRSNLILNILLGINGAYAVILLAWGCYLAYRVRSIPISMYAESKSIGFAIYNTVLFGTIAVTVHLAIGNTNRHLVYMIMVMCCIIGCINTTSFLFIPKWMSIRRNALYDTSSPMSSLSTCNTKSSSSSPIESQTPAHDYSRTSKSTHARASSLPSLASSSTIHANPSASIRAEQIEIQDLNSKIEKLERRNKKLQLEINVLRTNA